MQKLTTLSNLDWIVVGAVLAFTFTLSLIIRDSHGKGGVEEFFTANRNAKWWFLGTSIAATTFASDTPLVITGWISQYGIAGNWFWWGGGVGIVAITLFFARVWRSSGVVTDAEIAELRYGGKPAAVLRTTKAFIFSIFVNCVVLGWVLAGMSKIAEPFMDWEYLLGSSVYATVVAYFPSFLIFGDLNTSLTIFTLIAITLGYSAVGGLKAIFVTDMVWFVLAMTMAVVLALFSLSAIGGIEQLWIKLETLYPVGSVASDLDGQPFLSHQQLTSFIPSFSDNLTGSLGIPFSAFILTLSFMWWTNGNVDGAGFFAQRLYSAENSLEAEKGALWYGIAHFVFRSWPWVLAGLVALVMFPRVEINQVAKQFNDCLSDDKACTVQIRQCLENRYACSLPGYSVLVRKAVVSDDGVERMVFREDRERSYPALIKDVLPAGLLGLALVALMGAFMSTVSTHINWGASYIANDFYLRYLNPEANSSQLMFVSRLATIAITVAAIVVASFIENVGAMWQLYLGMMAGLGIPHLLRWFWWRANAWTELVGMLTGMLLACLNHLFSTSGWLPEGQISIFPTAMANHSIHVICWISVAAALASVIATYLSKPVDDDTLRIFINKVRPIGFWRGMANGYQPERTFLESSLYFVLGCIGLYAGLFGIGHLLKSNTLLGGTLVLLFVVTMWGLVRGLGKIENAQNSVQAESASSA